MQIITGFDSESSEEKKPLSQEYSLVLDALVHNKEVAENAFARISKAQIREQVGDQVRRIRLDEVGENVTQWFVETSIAICLGDLEHSNRDVVVWHLTQEVKNFGVHLLNVVTVDKVLVDSLNTKILLSGETVYQFRLKQKWASSHHV